MSVPAFVTEQMVRDVIGLEPAATSRYSSDTISSNMRSAASFLERKTHRILFDRTTTVRISTEGKASVTIPGLRTASSVSHLGSTLSVDETYWLRPDPLNTGLYTAIQLRAFDIDSGAWYLSHADWFDRNLDSPYWTHGPGRHGALPNDLEIVGAWGFLAGEEPEELLHAYKVLAAWYTKRGDILLGGSFNTEEGSTFDLSQYPVEVQAVISGEWKLPAMAVSIG